jgi:uncharacterized Zn finger protein
VVPQVIALLFHVQGSEPEPYSVEITVDGPALAVRCTCVAGKLGQWCKHKMSLVTGDTKSLVSSNPEDVALLVRLIPQTSAAALIKEVIEAEQQAEDAKQRIKLGKAALAKAVRPK